MTSIVAGLNLGIAQSFINSSQGNANVGSNHAVNVATGNLFFSRQDGFIKSTGPDLAATRVYNSQGEMGDNGHYFGVPRLINLPATGLAATLLFADGSTRDFNASGKAVQDRDAIDSLSKVSGKWRLKDGATDRVWYFDDKGLLESVVSMTEYRSPDDGFSVTYTYDSQDRLTDISDGNQLIKIIYNGNNIQSVTSQEGSVVLSHIEYKHDARGRIIQRHVDLSPDNKNVSDGNRLTTSYTYKGTSDLIASITQSDGRQVSFTYASDGTVYQVNEGDSTLTFLYNLQDGSRTYTRVTDERGANTRYYLDSDQQIVEISGSPINGVRPTTKYTYNNRGQVLTMTDNDGVVTTNTYDTRGNNTRTYTSTGQDITRTFNFSNQMTSETVKISATESATTNWVYNGNGYDVRYKVSADGGVTRYDYYETRHNQPLALGQLRFTRAYKTAYTGTMSVRALDAFLSAERANTTQYTQFLYDLRGQLSKRIDYKNTTSTGNGTSAQRSENYTYDYAGRLVAQSRDGARDTTHEYDAAGRLLWSENAEGAKTTYAYLEGGATTQITTASGLTTTTTINNAGQVISQASSAGNKDFGREERTYNDRGLLSSVLESDGGRAYRFYYDNGLLQAEISSTGTATRYTYFNDGNLKAKRVHATKVNTQGYFVNGKVAHTDITSKLPSNSDADRVSSFKYDNANRLIEETSPLGAVTTHTYDLAGRQIFSQVSGSGEDRKSWTFYNKSGQVIGGVGPEGYVTANTYNGVGQLTKVTRYANKVSLTAITAGNWNTVKPISSSADQSTHWLYNNLNKVIAEVDAENYVTETKYNGYGDVSEVIRYAKKTSNPTATTLAALRPTTDAQDQSTSYTYNGLGLLATESHHNGLVVRHYYDDQGRLIKNIQEDGAKRRASLRQLDAAGQVIGTLTGAKAFHTSAYDSTAVQAAIDLEGNVVSYDEQGRAIKTVDALGGVTLNYFDLEGRLVASVDATGSITQNTFNQLGDITETRVFAKKLGLNLNDLNGGDISEIQTTLNTLKDNDLDTITTFTYNSAGQVRFAYAGSVEKESRYNAFGELTRSFVNSGDRVDYTYDKRGLQTKTTIDPNGLNQETTVKYDAFGRVYESIDAAGQKQLSQFDKLGRNVKNFDALNIGSATTFDAFNRVMTTTDKAGDTVTYTYSVDGKTTTETFSDGSQVTTTKNAFGDTISTVDANGNETTFDYNEKGQLVLTTDAKGVKTETTYDKNGNVDTTRTIEPGTGNAPDKVWGEVTRTYFADGLLKSQTNALGHTESWTYDAQGNKATYTNADGKVWQYRYDQENRLTHEIAPSDNVYYWNNGSIQTASAANSVTVYEYNAKGQLEKEIRELWKNGAKLAAANTATTSYTYNAKGERIKTEISGVQLDLSKSAETLTTKELRDALGRAVTVENAEGVRIYQAFDARGQERFTVDGEGHLSEQQYDNAGRLIKSIRYANKVPSAASKGFAAYSEADLMSEATRIRSSQDRWVSYQYNALGQKVASRTSGGELTKWTYNAGGQVDSESTLIGTNENDKAHFAHKHYHYTERGELAMEIISVSATQAYVTSYTYHANGEVAEKIEHAAPITLPSSEKTRPTLPVETAASIESYGYDRVTQTTLDTLGRVAITKERIIVQDRNGNTTDEWLTTKTNFSKAGLVTQVNRGGRITDYEYDASGQLKREKKPETLSLSQTDLANWIADGGTMAQLKAKSNATRLNVFYYRDVNGQVLREIQAAANDSRTIKHQYNAQGQLLKSIDAEGQATVHVLDKLGRVVKTQRAFQDYVQGSSSGVTRYATTEVAFDKNGQQIATTVHLNSTLNSGKAISAQVNASVYNAFGEVVASGLVSADKALNSLTASDFEAKKVYDSRGRLSSINHNYEYAKEARVLSETYTYGFNAQGQQTLTISKPGAGSVTKIFNHLGQTVAEYGPSWVQEGEAMRQETTLTLDRWGQSLAVKAYGNYNEHTVKYRYNTRGQQIWQQQPTTIVYQADTTSGYAIPMEYFGYNPFGEVIWHAQARAATASSTPDLSHRTEHQHYNDAGQLVSKVNGAGDTTTYFVNAFGEKLVSENGAGQYALEQRNGLGQVIETGQWLEQQNTYKATQRYRYNALGQRTHTINLRDITRELTTITRFDARGLVIETRTQRYNDVINTQTAYNERGQKIEHSAGGRSENWTYGDDGRLLKHTNIGRLDRHYRYDEFGRLQQTQKGQVVEHRSYFEDGKLAWVRSGQGDLQARSVVYRYGRDGNERGHDTTVHDNYGRVQMHEEAVRTYDWADRTTSYNLFRAGEGIAEQVRINYGYDANGNRIKVTVDNSTLPGDIIPDGEPPVATVSEYTLGTPQTRGEPIRFRLPKSLFQTGDNNTLFYHLQAPEFAVEVTGIDLDQNGEFGSTNTETRLLPALMFPLEVVSDGDELLIFGEVPAGLSSSMPTQQAFTLVGTNYLGQSASVKINYTYGEPQYPGPRAFRSEVDITRLGDLQGAMNVAIDPASYFYHQNMSELSFELTGPAGLAYQFDGQTLRYTSAFGATHRFTITATDAEGQSASVTLKIRRAGLTLPPPGPGPGPLPPQFGGGLSTKKSLALRTPFQLSAQTLSLQSKAVTLAEDFTVPWVGPPVRSATSKTYWYAYDNANRVTLAEGIRGADNRSVWIDTTQGRYFEYNAAGQVRLQSNGRKIERFDYNSAGQQTHVYEYKGLIGTDNRFRDRDARLALLGESTDRFYTAGVSRYYDISEKGWALRSTSTYNRDGRLKEVKRWAIENRTGSTTAWRLRLNERELSGYNGDTGQVSFRGAYQDKNKNGQFDTGEYVRETAYQYNAGGDIQKITHLNRTDDDHETTQLYSYLHDDRALVYKIVTNYSGSNEENAYVTPGISEHRYDSSGNLVEVRDVMNRGTNKDAWLRYQYNHQGQLVHKARFERTNNRWALGGDDNDSLHYFLDGKQSLATLNRDGEFKWTLPGNPNANDVNGRSVIYTQAGDSLSSIAARLFGDSSLWYLIADENGLSSRGPNEVLTADTRLLIPAAMANKNNAATFTPFNQSAAIGDTAISQPQFTPKGGNSFVKLFLITLVAIMATYYGFAVLGGGQGLYAGWLGGVVGNTAQQGMAMALGVQDKFDPGQLAVAGISGAISQGVTEAGVGDSFGDFGKHFTRGAIDYTVKTGLSNAFTDNPVDFTPGGLAAAALTAGITGQTGLSAELGSANLFANIFNNAVGATMERLLNKGGSQDWRSILTRSLAQSVANIPIERHKERLREKALAAAVIAKPKARDTVKINVPLGMAGASATTAIEISRDEYKKLQEARAEKQEVKNNLFWDAVATGEFDALDLAMIMNGDMPISMFDIDEPSQKKGLGRKGVELLAAKKGQVKEVTLLKNPMLTIGASGQNALASLGQMISSLFGLATDQSMRSDTVDGLKQVAADPIQFAKTTMNDFLNQDAHEMMFDAVSLGTEGFSLVGAALKGSRGLTSFTSHASDYMNTMRLSAGSGMLAQRGFLEMGYIPWNFGTNETTDVVRGMGSRGSRNENMLTEAQQTQIYNHVEELGLDSDDFLISSHMSVYSDNWDKVFLGPNVFPGTVRTANTVFETMTPRSVIAHEAGHMITTRNGTAFEAGSLFDEVGASLTGRELPGLNNVERYQLLRDAVERARNDGQNLRDVLRQMKGK